MSGMSEKTNIYQSEFYFEYKFYPQKDELKLFGENAEAAQPRIWVERQYSKCSSNYGMYITFPQWFNRDAKDRALKYDFDNVQILFNSQAVSLPSRSDEEFQNQCVAMYIDKERDLRVTGCDRINFSTSGYRYAISMEPEKFSGVGEIRFHGSVKINEEEKTSTSVLYFATNFGFKRKLTYRILKKNGKIIAKFNDPDIDEDVELRIAVLNHESYYPCVKNSTVDNRAGYAEIVLKRGDSEIPLDSVKSTHKVYLTFCNDDDKKYYILHCAQNDTVILPEREHAIPKQVPFCPYCHNIIEVDGKYMKRYKKGCVSCRSSGKQERSFFRITASGKRKKVKKVLYCQDEFIEDKFNRIFPANYLDEKHFKIAVTGSQRAGKSVYISRLFGVKAAKKADGKDEMIFECTIANAMSKLGKMDMTSVMKYNKDTSQQNDSKGIQKLLQIFKEKSDKIFKNAKDDSSEKAKQNGISSATVDSNDWFRSAPRYKNYVISWNDFIRTTEAVPKDADKATQENPLRFPFAFDFNQTNHIYMYDFAGEDAQTNSTLLEKLLSNLSVPVGLFFIVPADKGHEEADLRNIQATVRFLQILRNKILGASRDDQRAYLANFPVAVILTKFDMVEHKFDENCHCRRSDAVDMLDNGKRYEGSTLEQHIRLSSEEIKSYISRPDVNLLPDFDDEELNVCYFGVSSFNQKEAIYHKDRSYDEEKKTSNPEENRLQFSCSPKRIELPVIWMMKQFGVIS